MTQQKRKTSSPQGNRIPIALVLVVAIVGAGWLVWSQVHRYQTGAVPSDDRQREAEGAGPDASPMSPGEMGRPEGPGGSGGPGGADGQGRFVRGDQVNRERMERPSREEIRQEFSDAMDKAGVTEEQKKRIMNLPDPKNREDFQKYQQKVKEILTPEQQERLEQEMRGRMRKYMERFINHMMEGLSPEDQETLRRRIEARMQEWEQREGGPRRAPGE